MIDTIFYWVGAVIVTISIILFSAYILNAVFQTLGFIVAIVRGTSWEHIKTYGPAKWGWAVIVKAFGEFIDMLKYVTKDETYYFEDFIWYGYFNFKTRTKDDNPNKDIPA